MRTRHRVNVDYLKALLDLLSIPCGRKNWRLLNHSDSQMADGLVRLGLAVCDGEDHGDGDRAFQATPKGRKVAAAMFSAAHREIFGEDLEYRE